MGAYRWIHLALDCILGFCLGHFAVKWWVERKHRRALEAHLVVANDLIFSLTGTWKRGWSNRVAKKEYKQ